jgi:hypothetical protein
MVDGVLVAAPIVSCADLKTAGLNSSNIGTVEGLDGLGEFNFIESLDVSDTLFSSWIDLLQVPSLLGNLKVLIAGDNQFLQRNEHHIGDHPLTLDSLQTLALTHCGEKSFEIISRSAEIPNLKHLHLSYCDLKAVPKNLPRTLEELDLSFNQIAHFTIDEIAKLPYESLLVLNLNGNPLKVQLDTPGAPTKKRFLLRLEKLCMDNTNISTWNEAEYLSLICPNLSNLRMWSVPLIESALKSSSTRLPVDEPATANQKALHQAIRAKLLVRFSNVVRLNGTEVSARERWEAELSCLKSGELFPRREVLAAEHGYEESSVPKMNYSVPSSSYLMVNFQRDGKVVTRKLPQSSKLSNVVTVYCRLFSATLEDADELEIEFSTTEMDDPYVRRIAILENSDRLTLRDLVTEHVDVVAIRQRHLA